MKIKSLPKILFIISLIFPIGNSFALTNFFTIPDSTKESIIELRDSSFILQDTLSIPLSKHFIQKEENLLSNGFDNFILRKSDLNFTDYRYTANYFSNSQFGYVRNLGSIGQPNEVLLYGQGFGNISFLSDGIYINNRFFNSLDLNLYQSESIDSLEIIPFSRGFLYGTMNNPVSVNFITKEFKTNVPYTRIKFYQAPYEEGMFDGVFSSNFSNKLSTYFQITHYSTEPRYRNSDYGSWQVLSRLRYILSDQVTLIGSYNYSKSNVQLNGGVNADSIRKIVSSNQFENILYNNIQAPVNFINRYQKVSFHNANIKALLDIIKKHPTELSFYYQSALNEFRQNENRTFINYQPGIDSIINDNKFNTFGFQFRQNYNTGLFSFQSVTNYEQTKLYSPNDIFDKEQSVFSSSIVGETNIKIGNRSLIPSLFGKYTYKNNKSFFGLGIDIRTSINNYFNLYGGFSHFENSEDCLSNQLNNNATQYTNIELCTSFNFNSLKLSVGYIHQKLNHSQAINNKILDAANFKFDLNIWKINLNFNSNYYFNKETQRDYKTPEFTLYGGIYFIDTLFNSNLYLKTGLSIKSFGTSYYTYIDFEKYITSSLPFNSAASYIHNRINPSTQIDFFLTGQIQKNATIYFVFENILNTKYYLVQYYPMYERGMRFGIAWEFFN